MANYMQFRSLSPKLRRRTPRRWNRTSPWPVQAGAKVVMVDGDDPAAAILGFARAHGITQIFVGHSKRAGLLGRFSRGPIDRLIDETDDIDVRVFPN